MSWDPLFTVPFFAGLLVAAALATIGVLLRLRQEWLAALGFAHLAGASALLGLAIHLPAVISATGGALLGATVKTFGKSRGNTIYALMILVGWSATMILAANTTLGSSIGHAMIEGQLYFSGMIHLTAAAILLIATVAGLYQLMPIVIRDRFFPGFYSANRLPAWRWHLAFDLLTALAMAIGTATVGLMAAFALVFLPPLIAFRLARHWRQALAISIGVGVVGYVLTFVLALGLDQPFGPVQVALLVLAYAVTPSLQSLRSKF